MRQKGASERGRSDLNGLNGVVKEDTNESATLFLVETSAIQNDALFEDCRLACNFGRRQTMRGRRSLIDRHEKGKNRHTPDSPAPRSSNFLILLSCWARINDCLSISFVFLTSNATAGSCGSLLPQSPLKKKQKTTSNHFESRSKNEAVTNISNESHEINVKV